MDALKAIEILKSRNQNFVNNNGVSDYSKQSDEIIRALINQYMLSKTLEKDLERKDSEISELLDQGTKHKLFLSVFGLPVDRITNIHFDVLKIIDREKIAEKYTNELGFFCIEFLFMEIESIQISIRNFMFPITAYFETYSDQLKKLYPDHTNYFIAIDKIEKTDLQAFENIYYDAYKFILSRLTRSQIKINE